MISTVEKLATLMASMAPVEVRTAIRLWGRVILRQLKTRRTYLVEAGFEEVDVAALTGEMLTQDGREVLWSAGKAWALQPEIHAKRLAEAMEQAKQRDAALAGQQQPASPPTVCTSLIDGQLCGGTLINAPVCPRCVLGKMGVAATLTCDVCGHVTAIMREAK